MHPALQAKLLHVLQDGEFSRLGGKRDISVDVRVLAATNKPLERAVEEGLFREDLFYRLNVITIHIPPLRERREEIPVFLDYFLRKYSEFYGKQPAAVRRRRGRPHDGVQLAGQHPRTGEPGQAIRDRRQRSRRSSANSPTRKPIGKFARRQHFGWSAGYEARRDAAPASRPRARHSDYRRKERWRSRTRRRCWRLDDGLPCQAEREAIERVLTQTRWNRRQAAKILKISYKALLNKLKAIEEQDADTK